MAIRNELRPPDKPRKGYVLPPIHHEFHAPDAHTIMPQDSSRKRDHHQKKITHAQPKHLRFRQPPPEPRRTIGI